MAVPKRKTSKQRTATRYANWKATAPTLSECSHCKTKRPAHTVCPECGYYSNQKVIEVKE